MPDLEQGIPDTRLGEAVILIRAKLNDPTVVHRVGELTVRQHDQQRRIVWVGGRGRFTKPDRTTGGAWESAAETNRVQSSHTDHEFVTVYVQAEDPGATQRLLHALAAAIENSYGNIAQLGDYEVETQQRPGSTVDEGGAGHSLWAERIKLDVTFQWLVISENAGTKVMTALEHGC